MKSKHITASTLFVKMKEISAFMLKILSTLQSIIYRLKLITNHDYFRESSTVHLILFFFF